MHQYNAVLSLGPDHQCSNRRNRPLAPSFYYHTAPGSETPEGILACGPCDRWLVSIPLNGHSECTVGTETFLNSAVIAAVQNCILTPKLLKSTNYTWDLAYELLWFFAELAACVVCASASSLKPFFRRFIPQLFTSGLRYTNDSRDPTTGFSRGTNFRKSQMGRKPPDAYEFESADDGDSARRVKGEDETRLWSGNPLRPQEDVDRSILISSDRDRTLSAMGRALSVRRSETPLDDDKGINVVREVRVAYGPP